MSALSATKYRLSLQVVVMVVMPTWSRPKPLNDLTHRPPPRLKRGKTVREALMTKEFTITFPVATNGLAP